MPISRNYLPFTKQPKKYINRDMEEIEAAKPINSSLNSLSPVTQESEPLETKEYELNLNKDTYLLKMQLNQHEKISFKTLNDFLASLPDLLYPKIKSIQSLMCWETN